MNEYDYNDKFQPGLNDEEKIALIWKIEQDYLSCHLKAVSFRDEYITFAVNFYTRNAYSLEDVVTQFRAHRKAEMRRAMAETFVADIKHRLQAQPSEALM